MELAFEGCRCHAAPGRCSTVRTIRDWQGQIGTTHDWQGQTTEEVVHAQQPEAVVFHSGKGGSGGGVL